MTRLNRFRLSSFPFPFYPLAAINSGRDIGIGWLIASAIALGSAGAIAAGRSVNEVQGRASGPLPSAGIRAVNTTGLPASDVYGRGNQMSRPSGSAIGTGALGVGDFGRGSGTMAAAHEKHGAGDIAVATTK